MSQIRRPREQLFEDKIFLSQGLGEKQEKWKNMSQAETPRKDSSSTLVSAPAFWAAASSSFSEFDFLYTDIFEETRKKKELPLKTRRQTPLEEAKPPLEGQGWRTSICGRSLFKFWALGFWLQMEKVKQKVLYLLLNCCKVTFIQQILTCVSIPSIHMAYTKKLFKKRWFLPNRLDC